MRILIVEDDDRIAKPLAEGLKNEHHVVEIAKDGLEGWEYAQASDESNRIDLTSLLINLVDLYKPQAEALKIEFKVDIASNLAVIGGRNNLTRALTNLIQNALQYTPAGGKVNLNAMASSSN